MELGHYAAEMELKILKFANFRREGFGFGDLDFEFQVNKETGRDFRHPEEKWNHITDWRLVSAMDDLVRYGFLKHNKKCVYQITRRGIEYLSKTGRIVAEVD